MWALDTCLVVVLLLLLWCRGTGAGACRQEDKTRNNNADKKSERDEVRDDRADWSIGSRAAVKQPMSARETSGQYGAVYAWVVKMTGR